MRFRPFLILGIIAVGACPSDAQPPTGTPAAKPRYVPFPFALDAETLVQERLQQLKNLRQTQEFVEKFWRDSGGVRLLDDETLNTLKRLKLDNPRVQDHLKPWVERNIQGKPPVTPDEVAKFEDVIKQAAKDQESPPQSEAPPVEPAATEPDVPEPHDAESGMRDWLKDMIERAEESNVGEWLRDSPAFQKAIQDLHGSVRIPDAKANAWGLDRFFKLDKLPLPDQAAFERLGRFKPKLPHIDPPSLPSFSRPALPPMSAPSRPTLASLGTLATWLLGLALVAVAAWQVSRWIKLPGGAARAAAADLGPWPVLPEAVATRTELVQAFDYLALLLLGTRARTWHHRAVAQAIAQRSTACPGAAAQLAALYEQARYTDGAEPLATEQRDRARAALLQLAGGSA